jgi:spermidine synthase
VPTSHDTGAGPGRASPSIVEPNVASSEPVDAPDAPDPLDPMVARLRRDRALLALYPLFFLSGATGLTYQTLWARQLHLVFGTSTFAITTVLAAFMGGLAIGGFAMGRHADRARAPLALYGWFEIGIGLYALLFPPLLVALTPLHLGLWRALQPPVVLFGAWQFVVVGALLLVPTAMMGATLPLLARFATDRVSAAGDRVGTLYALNTAGAVAGTWLCGFVLLPILGLSLTTWAAAITNLLLGAAALWAHQIARGSELVGPTEDQPDPNFDPRGLAVAVAAGLGGFAALTYEVAWTRVLGLMLGASVYAFSLMLLAFLIGIAGGGWLGGRLADAALGSYGQRGLLGVLAGVQIGVGLLSYATLQLFPELPFVYVWLYDAFGASGSPLLLWSASMALAVLVMTPPAVLMGAAFPLAVRAVVGRGEALGGPVGRIYGFNTLGSVAGAALAGFVFLPYLAIHGTVVLAVIVNLAAGALLLGWVAWSRRARLELGLLGAVAALAVALIAVAVAPSRVEDTQRRQLLMTAGMYKYVSDLADRTRAGIIRYTVDQYDLLYYREGLSSVVTVARNRETGNIWLANNGKVEASTTVDMPTQVLVSLLPFLYAERPDEVLVIGLASGITAGSVTRISEVGALHVVELEPAIEQAARFFDEQNHRVLDDPRTRLWFNDGRNHLLLAPPGSYDVVISEPSNPWISGVSNLFTREFLRMGKERLAPGGVWAQWVQMYGMDRGDLCSLLATFADVYPHVALFMTVEDADLVMLGSSRPLPADPAVIRAALARHPGMAAELGRVGLDEPIRLLSAWQMGRGGIVDMCAGTPLNTDDNMRVEYGAPLNLHRSTAAENVERLLAFAELPAAVVEPVERLALAREYLSRADFDRGLGAALAAIEASGDPRFAAIVAEGREAWKGPPGWEGALKIALRGGDAVGRAPAPPPGWDRGWARWRVAMLRYLGEDVPDALLEAARMARRAGPDGEELVDLPDRSDGPG